jgi:excisionase family DNA binding protein
MSVQPKPIVNLETHDEPLIRLTQVCRYLGVNKRTALKWIANGLLRAYPLPGRGDWRLELAELQRFVHAQREKAALTAQRSVS